jgi:hypothetical protein
MEAEKEMMCAADWFGKEDDRCLLACGLWISGGLICYLAVEEEEHREIDGASANWCHGD